MNEKKEKIFWNWKFLFYCLLFVLFACYIYIYIGVIRIFIKPSFVSLTSLSPDSSISAQIVERGGFDRNFQLKILDKNNVSSKKEKVIFSSPDEGRPVGTERILWSKDNRYLLLLGQHFYIREESEQLENDEDLYLLYDIKNHKIWCNATQQSKYPNFSYSELEKINWDTALPKQKTQ